VPPCHRRVFVWLLAAWAAGAACGFGVRGVGAEVSRGASAVPWHHPLYLNGGGWWRARVPVRVVNRGDRPAEGTVVTVRIGAGADLPPPGRGEAPRPGRRLHGAEPAAPDLLGARAEALRVVDVRGTEMLWALVGPDGKAVVEGPIPAGARLRFPVECPPGGPAIYYIYFDNPTAWPVPDFLDDGPTTRSGRAEGGERLAVEVLPAERMGLREVRPAGGAAPASLVGGGGRRFRVSVCAWNFTDRPMGPHLFAAPLHRISARLRGRFDPGSLALVGPEGALAPMALGEVFLFEGTVPPRSVATWYVYGRERPTAPAAPPPAAAPSVGGLSAAGASADEEAILAAYRRLLEGRWNLVRNPSFEAVGSAGRARGPAEGWRGDFPDPRPQGVVTDVVEGGRLGRRAARVHVPPGAAGRWVGWHQTVPVAPGRTYFYAGWVRCRDLRGEVRLHAHCTTAEGRLCAEAPYRSVGPRMSGTRGWTLLAGRLTMPADCARLQLHLTTNAAGTIWYDGVVVAEVASAEVVGPFEALDDPSAEGLRVWPVPALVKVFRDDVPPPGPPAEVRATAARGEAEPIQLAVRSPKAVADVRVVVDPPVGPGGARLRRVGVGVVGYVPIDHPTSYYRSTSPTWHRKFPTAPGGCDGWAGWWPDPLLPRDRFDLAAGRTQPVWLTVHVPPEAPPGDYRGRVRLEAEGQRLAEVPFTVHVWNFRLPARTRFRAIYDVRIRGRWWKDDVGGDRAAYLRRVWKMLAAHRLSPDRIQPEPVIRYKDGKVEADFSAYDEAAAYYFNELGFPHTYTPHLFYCFGWGHPPRRFQGEDPYPGGYPYEGADRSRLRPQYKRAYQACLRAYWEHMKAKGWAERVVLYIADEPHDRRDPAIVDQMKALCAMIHEVDPAIPIYSSTWHHQPAWEGSLDVWGIGHFGVVPPETMRRLRAGGARLWFTTDGHMCTDTPYCAIERLLPHYAFAWGAEAYEFWGLDWLTYNPWRFGWHAYIPQSDRPGNLYYVRYPNGDGFLVYPGTAVGARGPVPTVRLEQAREGVEDYEYLCILRDRIARAKAAGRPTAEAERVLRDAAALVPIPAPNGRYSTRVLPDPEAVLRLKERLGRAIERLGD